MGQEAPLGAGGARCCSPPPSTAITGAGKSWTGSAAFGAADLATFPPRTTRQEIDNICITREPDDEPVPDQPCAKESTASISRPAGAGSARRQDVRRVVRRSMVLIRSLRSGTFWHMPEPRPLSDDEAVEVIAAAIRGAGGRPLTREADLLLASDRSRVPLGLCG